ncbi:hypothetical protein LTR28_011656, partial [Elasticomyces elasticus]
GTTLSGGAPSQFTSTHIAHLLRTGELQRHIRHTLQPAYASRYRTLVSAIETHLAPLGVTLPQRGRQVVGGYFVWLTLPHLDSPSSSSASSADDDVGARGGRGRSVLRGDEVRRRAAEEENVRVAWGEMFEVPGDRSEVNRFPNQLRLCFSWEDEAVMEEGVRKLAGVVGRMIRGEGGGGGGKVDGKGEDIPHVHTFLGDAEPHHVRLRVGRPITHRSRRLNLIQPLPA